MVALELCAAREAMLYPMERPDLSLAELLSRLGARARKQAPPRARALRSRAGGRAGGAAARQRDRASAARAGSFETRSRRTEAGGAVR